MVEKKVMKKDVLIQLDEEIVKAMNDAHLNKSSYINGILKEKFAQSNK